MKLNLTHNWRDILRRAWSIRLILLAAILSGAEVALMFWVPDWPAGVLAALSGLVSAGALVSRILAQSNMED
ncbi:hypothetical protein [Pseudosulfitobacter pseudonitzschiae]|uniref:DUF7940 domain-containing protein n=1 Tax=Pseudosulfitobacter pseudonitzschiae TaxID=1402135 RepID=UPI001AF92DA9|nr:hypothetical protein [Pseudosulfitobacter pseudonitzschiae]MBM1817153.1 hypothetical protein [Pseudosulfitobacter pseudonitzschiae]MBM1834156.1 hypothetical protein [Pseudosulfitobacter pseudonitzschiae]MBM1839021.1 hypothetical protein [Pseudosulfitobacter pseudonitzschiae]MBM1843871.1 hypothetical protein [Pseudosulfitobacter pseudonitzschiae]MBM1848717.1 hypothetical protein [Pseudosulfitobacter pseudonitzschiae]